jgi:hypothetical protein
VREINDRLIKSGLFFSDIEQTSHNQLCAATTAAKPAKQAEMIAYKTQRSI